jgi:xylulokinase
LARSTNAGGAAAEPPYLIGLDAGTSRIRGVMIGGGGRIVAEAGRATPTRILPNGWAEYDAEELWNLAKAILHELARGRPAAGPIAGVAVTSVGDAGVPVDADGKPLGPIIAWYCPRTEREKDWLAETLGADRIFQVTGMPLDRSLGLCKILWWRTHAPEVFARMRRWLNVADWIAFRLCGEAATDLSLASRTLALDLNERAWSEPLLEAVGIEPAIFPPIAANGTAIGRLRPDVAAETGVDAAAIVSVGAHDHVAGAIAAGAIEPGILLDSMGTAEALILALARPVLDRRLLRLGLQQSALAFDAPVHLLVAGLLTSGAAIEWFRSACANGADHARLIAMAASVQPGSDGVVFIPHLRLGAPPHPNPRARGAFLGISPEVTTATLYRSVLEGLALAAAGAVEAMLSVSGRTATGAIRVIGGGTRNDLLLRIKASAYGLPLEVSPSTESTALGAALLAGLGSGRFADWRVAVECLRRTAPLRLVEPDPAWTKIYSDMRPRLLSVAAHTDLWSAPR